MRPKKVNIYLPIGIIFNLNKFWYIFGTLLKNLISIDDAF